MKTVFTWAAALAFMAACALPQSASAQAFPSKPITIIVPTPPAGPLDMLARLLAKGLQQRFNQTVTVENKPGAGAIIGTQIAARAPKDGHTLLMHNTSLTAFKLFVRDLGFDAEKDLVPLGMAMASYYVLGISDKTPGKTLPEFLAYAKANPGKLNAAVLPNSVQLLDTLRLMQTAGFKAETIPYNGVAPIVTSLLANDVHFFLGPVLGMGAHFKTEKLVPLAVAGPAPLPDLPGVPTARSFGVDFQARNWTGVFTTGGTPKEVVATLAREIRAILDSPEAQAQIKAQGYDPLNTGPEEMARIMAAEGAAYASIARAFGIVPQ